MHISQVMGSTRSRRAPRRVRAVLGAAILCVAAAGCDGKDEVGGTRPTTTATVEATTTTASADGAVLAGYRGFWDAYLAAADPMDPSHPDLTAHAVNPELERIQRAFLSRKVSGEVIRGDLDLAPKVVTTSDASAEVRDCYLDNTGVFDASSGVRKDTASGVRHQVLVELVLDGGAWKVREITKESDGCVAE
jgi:hypothetical protein